MLAHQLLWLNGIDHSWTEKTLLICFDPALPEAEAAWSGFLWAQQAMPAQLFKRTKDYFVAAFPASRRWRADGLAQLAHHLAIALNRPPKGPTLLTHREARRALQTSTEEVRIEALVFLRSLKPPEDYWDRLMVPFFRDVWPREQEFQTTGTTRVLLGMLSDSGKRFPALARLVGNYLVPSAEADMFVFQFGSDRENGRADLIVRYPHDSLFVLDKIIAEGTARPPYGLGQVLSRLVEAASEIRVDSRWQRLHRLVL